MDQPLTQTPATESEQAETQTPIPREPSVAHSDVNYNLFVGYLPSKNFSAHRVKVRLIDTTRFTGTMKRNHFTEILCKQSLVIFDNKGCSKVDKGYPVLNLGMQIAPTRVVGSNHRLKELDLKLTVGIQEEEPKTEKPDDVSLESNEDGDPPTESKVLVELEAKLRHDPEGVPQKIRL